jgi:hypothetical protein
LSLTLREDHILRVFENTVLRRIYEPKRDEVVGGWRRLHEFHNLYTTPNIIRVTKSSRIRLTGHVACMVEMRKAYKILVGKPEGKRPHGRPKCRWEDNIEMGLKEWSGKVWTGCMW